MDQEHLKKVLEALPKLPGVYRMLDETGQLLYVGKAKNLKARVSSYFNQRDHSTKTIHLVAKIADIHTTVTASETEALLLEQTLIKKHQPPYNILLRDDKSYPYIYLSQHEYPRLGSVRGRRSHGRSFGPFPSGSAVRFSLGVLQKAFKIRQCHDSYFRHRSRPCLEYQINRCTAPCVGLISQEDYAQDVEDTVQFLQGKTTQLMADLTKRMEKASIAMDYEHAAQIRDQIAILRQIQEVQHVDTADGDIDIFAVSQDMDYICVQSLVVRKGQLTGGQSHFQKTRLPLTEGEILESFIAQYYMSEGGGHGFPQSVILSHALPDDKTIEILLAEFNAVDAPRVRIVKRATGHKQAWLNMAVQNAVQGLNTRKVTHSRREETYGKLRDWLQPDLPQACVNRFECFDISHTQGEATKASCVVFDHEGPRKDLYRSYNIRTTDTGDDYQAMAEVIERRYSKLDEKSDWPWLIIIDGGLGQLGMAARVFKAMVLKQRLDGQPGFLPQFCLLGVAKGVTRKAGFETLYRVKSIHEFIDAAEDAERSCMEELIKPEDQSVLRLIHEIRDESHRFAITGHRKAREKARTSSSLESIQGVGPKRRSALLKYFGGLQGVKRASIDDLCKVEGVNRPLAESIYHHLRQIK